jgi:predicted RNA binding protein YcfA (HicA-like mRNA interferase family)
VSILPKSTSRRDLIKRFKELGWTGPYQGVGKHPEYMQHPDGRTKAIPNVHTKKRSDIGEGLLKSILAEAQISHDDWVNG